MSAPVHGKSKGRTRTGLDSLMRLGGAGLEGKKVGLLCNQASLTREGAHAIDAIRAIQPSGQFELDRVFGPQHGLWGHTQDDMIEWEGRRDERTGLAVHSLYGRARKPTPEMLAGLDTLLVDLQDVGARYYTFVWTLSLCMEACAERGIEVCVLDRPNPVGGVQVEGTVLQPEFASFVGLHPLPMRHGMTLGEIAGWFRASHYGDCKLKVVPMEGWSRELYFEDTGLIWAPPSPNMPTPNTALVYPGMCLLEGTNLSEGRGTTRPFETFGAPYLDGHEFAGALNEMDIPGALFRPVEFQPTFQKHAGDVCGGAFLHVLDPSIFRPVRAATAALLQAMRLGSGRFRWREPPYEYEEEKLPFDVLAGNDWLRLAIEDDSPLAEICERMDAECDAIATQRRQFLLYP